MKISYNWLKEYVNTTMSAKEMADCLTAIGLEVEGVEKIEAIRGGLEGVCIGEVLTCDKHPDADKLHLTTVNVGAAEPLQIVCGAPNVAAGEKVIVATIGAQLYPTGEDEPFKIKKSKIRGVESFGMLCAEDELGIGEGHDGIMLLEKSAVPGTPAREYFNIQDDYVLEIGLTPNRIDAASHIGVARDLVAYLKSIGQEAEVKLPSVENFAVDKIDNPVEVVVENQESAPRYMGLTIRNVEVKPSPEWLQTKLRALGMNPHNNVVDITNFILHELGQPLHAFDADKIAGNKVVVRNCPQGTPFVTLDGIERKLDEKDLMICDAEKPMCIAGVFGGINSGVTLETKNVFLESAYFNPVSVRKTAKRHGLSTDASFRYERGTDPLMPPYALKRAALLIKELTGGEIASEVTDIYKEIAKPFVVELSFKNVDRLIGKQLCKETITRIVTALEMEVLNSTEEGLTLAVPPYRVDVQREADVIEDILRIYGYNNVEIPMQVNSTLTYSQNQANDRIYNVAADLLTSNGFHEIMSNSLTKSGYYEGLTSFPVENCVKIMNPLSSDLNMMRQTLLFNALEAASLNINHKRSDLKMYEFGNCYFYDETKKEQGGLAPYSETYTLGILVSGQANEQSWNVKVCQSDFYSLKVYAEKLLARFGVNINNAQIDPLESDLYREAVRYSFNGKRLFDIGIVAKKIRNTFDIKQEVYFLEMDFDRMIKMAKGAKVAAKELSKYPEVRRDLALLVDKNVTFRQLRDLAFKTERKLLKKVGLFDVYEGDKLPEGKKSYALNFVLEDTTKTMTDAVIDKVMSTLIAQFDAQLGAKVR